MAGRVVPVTRRIHPRHCTETVTVRPWTDDGTLLGRLGAPEDVQRVQVQQSHEIATDGDGPRAVTLLEVRVPPRATLDVAALFAPDSQITYRGSTSFVLTCETVRHRGGVAFTRVIAGDRPSPFAGSWAVLVRITPSPGRDRWGDPIPAGAPREVAGSLKPKSTGEPGGFDQTTESTATLYLPGTESVASTDRVDVLDSPLAGRWLVDGDPHPEGTALAVPLRRT